MILVYITSHSIKNEPIQAIPLYLKKAGKGLKEFYIYTSRDRGKPSQYTGYKEECITIG